MNKFSLLFVVAFAYLVREYECVDLSKLQIKMTNYQIWYANPNMINELKYHVSKGNATYNKINLHWDVKYDLPADIRLETKLFVTDKNGDNAKFVLRDITYVCREDETRELLPKVLIVDQSDLNMKCIKKGVYDMDDIGQFRFEILKPNIGEIGKYYRTDYRFASRFVTIADVTFWSEWGYLNIN